MKMITAYRDLHDGVLYWMEEDDIELMYHCSLRQNDEESTKLTKELGGYMDEQSQLEDELWRQVEVGYGRL
eukprot:3203570-Amphidinium_carterae.1